MRVVVSSANSPRFQANPNTGLPLIHEDGRTIVAENTIHHDDAHPSSIILPVVGLPQIPKHNVEESVAKLAESLGGGEIELAARRAMHQIVTDLAMQTGGL